MSVRLFFYVSCCFHFNFGINKLKIITFGSVNVALFWYDPRMAREWCEMIANFNMKYCRHFDVDGVLHLMRTCFDVSLFHQLVFVDTSERVFANKTLCTFSFNLFLRFFLRGVEPRRKPLTHIAPLDSKWHRFFLLWMV